jgi:ankyrin repeat protein
MFLCSYGNVEIVKFLILEGVNIHQSIYGYTLISMACRNGHLEIVTLLLLEGANIHEVNSDGFTPISLACRGGS